VISKGERVREGIKERIFQLYFIKLLDVIFKMLSLLNSNCKSRGLCV